MNKAPDFDLQSAHRFFSADCYNRAWDLIDTPRRTPEQDEQMIRLSLASSWHWTQRPDCTDTNLSIGYWQTSRIYALLGQVENARRYGQLCLEKSQATVPFFLGYAHEALARAEALAGNRAAMQSHLQAARQAAEQVQDVDDRKQLLDDLETII